MFIYTEFLTVRTVRTYVYVISSKIHAFPINQRKEVEFSVNPLIERFEETEQELGQGDPDSTQELDNLVC